MAFDKIDGSSVKRALLGTSETAIIYVRDMRKKAEEVNLGEPKTTVPALQVQAPLEGAAAPTTALKDMIRRSYRVQFNPRELVITGSQGITQLADLSQVKKKPSGDFMHEPPKITMSVNLIFDQVNLFDSFMCERLTPGAAAMMTNVATGIAKAAGTVWSVQPVVEGFIAALRNPNTRRILFHWGEFEFYGDLTELSAEYVMFSLEGHPVRAKVRMRVVNVETASEKWDNDFKEAFKGDSSNLVTTGQGLSNIVNMGAIF
ncbi:MAG: hypothetical protein FWD34_01165 [Oscillospiraceae bacterium]|nr:hypothetical protein [Oscillospiraceae bacterium]